MKFYSKKWQVLRNGGSDEWLYVANKGKIYVFIQIHDLVASCGKDATQAWSADVSLVDLNQVTSQQTYQAIQSCGREGPVEHDLFLAKILWEHGDKAPCWDKRLGAVKQDKFGYFFSQNDNGRDFRGLRKEARLVGEKLLNNLEYREERLSRIVNKIGQTAREYAGGIDRFWDKLRAIKDNPKASTVDQKLILKMYQKGWRTLGAGPVPKDILC